MRDRKLELGTFEALAEDAGITVAQARRWSREGPPARWSDGELEDFAAALYARADVASRERDPAARAHLQAKRHAPVYAPAAMTAAAASLERALGELGARRACEKGTWSPRAELARQLGVTSVRLGRWLAAGRVPGDSMPAFSEWAEQRATESMKRMAERGHVEQLLAEARRPEPMRVLTGADARAPRKMKVRAPDIASGERLTQSEEQAGYVWQKRVERWLGFSLVSELYEWARTRRRLPGSLPARNWIVTALCSIYHPGGRKPGRKKSPGAIREFGTAAQRQRGNDLSINVPVSSYGVERGGLERAAKLFREALTVEACDEPDVFVHAVIVRNWRNRTESERKNYRERLHARLDAERRQAERGAEAKRAEKRLAAKKKALGRARGKRPRPGPRRKA